MQRLPFDYAVRNLLRSPKRLAMSLLGTTLVVLLVLSAAAFVRGLSQSLISSGNPANVILLGAGSEESVERSEISPAAAELLVASVPGIRTRLGQAYVSPEVHIQTTVQEDRTSTRAPQIMLRGVTPTAFLVHQQVRLSNGRLPTAGRDDILVGRLAGQKLGIAAARMAIGQTLWFDDRAWQIVGQFEAPGSVVENEIWCPLSDLQIASRRDNLSCVVLTLGDAEYDDVDLFAKQRLDLELVAMRETEYYGKLSAFFSPIRAMVWATAILIATGGVLGGLNTMYAAFASRVREVGALQAMGFSRRAIVVNLVEESVLAAVAGTVLAAAVGLLLLDGIHVQFSTGVFGLVVDGSTLLAGIVAGILLGLIGAIPPAIRCLRLPITEALKSW